MVEVLNHRFMRDRGGENDGHREGREFMLSLGTRPRPSPRRDARQRRSWVRRGERTVRTWSALSPALPRFSAAVNKSE
jgi:hypothetical protein